MNEAGHRQRALDVEHVIADLGDPAAKPYICAVLIESYWGAALHWLVVGCMIKHNWHTDSPPASCASWPRWAETTVATHWATLERLRTNGWYSYQANVAEVAQAQVAWRAICVWATT